MLIWAGPLLCACVAILFYLEWRFAFTGILLDEALVVVIVALFGMTLWPRLWPLFG
jgi:hypothetical protein